MFVVIRLGIGLLTSSVCVSSVLLGIMIGLYSSTDVVLFRDTAPTVLYVLLLVSAIAEELGCVPVLYSFALSIVRTD